MTALTDWAKRSMAGRPTEATITRKVIKALKDAGQPVTIVFDGGERTPVDGKNAILNEVFNLDESYLITEDGSWVRLVMGNGYDIVCDYTTNLEDILQPVSDWCAEREAA
jgi:hypothetical protein